MSDADRYLRYTIVKGFILGKEKNSRQVNGLFLGVAAGMKQYYLKVRFIFDEIDRGSPWEVFLETLNGGCDEDGNIQEDALSKYEKGVYDFITQEGVLLSEKDVLNDKMIERKTTYFCSDAFDVNAVTFIELMSVTGDEIYSLIPFMKKDNEPSESKDIEEENEEVEDLFISCGAVIDPVSGVPASRLVEGDTVFCRLPESSPFYELCASTIPKFDGVVTGEVTGVKINEFGSAVIAINLSEGISGALKLSSNIAIKTQRRGAAGGQVGLSAMTRLMLFSILCVVGLLIVIGLLFRFLS
ncbi:MAG: hypothetical protein LBT31_02455 [Synergistaceae bacterium]|jgi:hypothetical protein|nr:hypothetical protein [Synergistaceae bacterium]